MASDFEGRTAVVTGASSGIGEAVSWALARAGASVFLVGSSERVGALARNMSDEGHSAAGARVDVANHEALTSIYQRAAAAGSGRLDVAIHAAGVFFPGDLASMDAGQVRRTVETNLLGVIYASQAALWHMGTGSHIVNVSSVSGRVPSRSAVYTASKFAVTGFTESLRQEASHLGVRVTCVEPGLVETRFKRHVSDSEPDMRPHLSPEEVAEAILAILRLPPQVNVGEVLIRHIHQL